MGYMQPLKAPENRESLRTRKRKINKSLYPKKKERCDRLYLSVVTHSLLFIAANNSGLQNIFVRGDRQSWTSWDSVQVAKANATA